MYSQYIVVSRKGCRQFSGSVHHHSYHGEAPSTSASLGKRIHARRATVGDGDLGLKSCTLKPIN